MSAGGLTPLQVQATRLFFSLPDSAGFAVAGGAALIAHGLIQRPTRDVELSILDAQTSTVASAAAAFEEAIDSQGWSHRRVMDQQDFVRLALTGDSESLIIDLGRDSPAGEPVESTDLGPTLSARDLAARKTLALFGRAEARDFADVYDLALRYGRDRLLEWAASDDPDSTSRSSPKCSSPSTGSPTKTCQWMLGAPQQYVTSSTTGLPKSPHPEFSPTHTRSELARTAERLRLLLRAYFQATTLANGRGDFASWAVTTGSNPAGRTCLDTVRQRRVLTRPSGSLARARNGHGTLLGSQDSSAHHRLRGHVRRAAPPLGGQNRLIGGRARPRVGVGEVVAHLVDHA